jgi:hypothetical protein
MDLILHIGTEKTGTTSLQSWLAKNRDALRREGIFFPASLGETRSIRMAMMAADHSSILPAARRVHKIKNAEDHAKFVKRVNRDFVAERFEKQNRDCPTCIISDEGLQVFLNTTEEIARMKEFTDQHFGRVRVVICLRPQVDYAVSFASTAARLGRKIDSEWFEAIDTSNLRFRYDLLVERWAEVFGAENLEIISYQRNPDSIQSFCNILSLERAKFQEAERENSFLDWRYIRLMNNIDPAIRKSLPGEIPGVAHKLKLRISKAQADRITECFEESNRRLVQQRSDISFDELMPRPDSYDERENLSLVSKKMREAPFINALLGKLTQDKLETGKTVRDVLKPVLNAGGAAVQRKRKGGGE